MQVDDHANLKAHVANDITYVIRFSPGKSNMLYNHR